MDSLILLLRDFFWTNPTGQVQNSAVFIFTIKCSSFNLMVPVQNLNANVVLVPLPKTYSINADRQKNAVSECSTLGIKTTPAIVAILKVNKKRSSTIRARTDRRTRKWFVGSRWKTLCEVAPKMKQILVYIYKPPPQYTLKETCDIARSTPTLYSVTMFLSNSTMFLPFGY